jgi:hypothetical protein
MSASISKLMMSNLMEAWAENRLRCSSSRGVFKTPDASFVDHNTMQITAADGSFVCSLSPSTVALVLDGKTMAAVVTANSFGDAGVWIQVSCLPAATAAVAAGRCSPQDIFWLELYVPTYSQPSLATTSPFPRMIPRA